MKHKVGDKVRVKSKRWWDAQPKDASGNAECGADTFNEFMASMCGKVVEISDVLEDTYFIKEYEYNWTDEMFDDSYNPEKSILSEEMIKDIAEVVKKHNLGVSICEKDGNIIIEPLKVEEEDDLPIDTPCMVSLNAKDWTLGYYYKKGRVYLGGFTSKVGMVHKPYDYIIPFDRFNPNNIEESLKYNIVKY